MLTKTTPSEQQLLVDRLMRIDQGYFERDQVRIVPTYHLICTQTGEKLAKVELVSTDRAAVFELGILYSDFGVPRNATITEKRLKMVPNNIQRTTGQWTYTKFLYFLKDLSKDQAFEETVISLFP